MALPDVINVEMHPHPLYKVVNSFDQTQERSRLGSHFNSRIENPQGVDATYDFNSSDDLWYCNGGDTLIGGCKSH